MEKANANIDYCGIRNLLRQLIGHGLTEAEVKRIAARIAQSTGAERRFVKGIFTRRASLFSTRSSSCAEC